MKLQKKGLDIFEPLDKEKNRYKNILPFKYNCIKIGPEKNNYINASPIKAGEYYFVATQGPKQETIDDFWTMVWELKSKVIVMLCDIYEGNENKEKCAKY